MSLETTLVRAEPQSYEAGPAYDVYVGDRRVGRVARYSHTYRTKYTGSRIGYDRHHFCWWGERYDSDWRRNESFRCNTSRQKALDLIARSVLRDSPGSP